MLSKELSKETAYNKISQLVTRFGEQIGSYKNTDYNETLTRRDFIDPFFKALGWDMDNEHGSAEAYREVIHEDKIKIGSATKAPDYSFRLAGGKRLFFVEAKKPSVFVKEELPPAYQVRRYGWSAKLPISIVTDFEEFAIYDCTKKPKAADKASTARIKYLTYKEYLTEFDFLWDTFSKERVLKGSFDKFVLSDTGKKGTATVDKEFLESLNQWRKLLAETISINNVKLSEDELNFAVQQTLDRIIFLRICEDRGVEPYEKLKHCLIPPVKDGGVYKNLFTYFEEADNKYNSGLFDLAKDNVSRKLNIDNKILKKIIEELYYPDSPYEFSVLSVEILGSAYEQFLGKVIRLTPSHKAKIEEKPEVRKAGGVYYTPQYIVEYIVKNTVGELIEGKTPKDVEKIKIVDPACGSGSFLIGAYQYLLDWHLSYYMGKSTKDKTLTPDGRLTTAEKKKILINNIYGVDIDTQAVEVTKLSLLLKCMEGETLASVQQTMSFMHERILPTLENNVKSGNSLIDFDFYDGELEFEGTDRKIKPFNWQAAFPEVFKQGGFDCVIGNPPYVRMQTIIKQDTDYYKKTYLSADYGNYDMYILFIEKSLKLLTEKGIMGMILPHKFFQANYGEAIRKLISSNKFLQQINDFSTNQVFDNATTYTCLLFLAKTRTDKFKYQRIELGKVPVKELQRDNFELIESDKLNKDKWNFGSIKNQNVLDKITKGNNTIGYYASKIFKGSSTGNDKIYLLDLVQRKKKTSIVYSKQLDKNIEIENDLLKHFVYGSDLRKYHLSVSNVLLLFPYVKNNGKTTLVDIRILKEKYPLTFEYFTSLKSELKKRKIEVDSNNFYKYSAARSLNEYDQRKIMIPDILVENRVSIDEAGILFHGPAVHSIVFNVNRANYAELYFLGILNSGVFWFFIKNTSTALRGDAYRLIPEFIEPFPIPKIDFTNPAEKKKHDEIIKHVETNLELNRDLQKAKLATQQEQIKQRITYTDKKIDALVYELYGLTEEEIKVVEGV